MSLNQEEIRIKAGLDYSKVTAGLTDIRSQVYKLANDVPKQLGNILKANVFGAASSLFASLIPSIDEFWQKLTGTDPETMSRKAEMNEEFRALANAVTGSKKNLQAALRDERVRNATARERLELARKELAAEERNLDNNRDRVEFYSRQKDELEQQLSKLKEISKQQQLYNTGLPGGPVLGSTPAAEDAKAQIPVIEEAIRASFRNIATAQTGVNESATKLAGLRGARDAAAKDMLTQYWKYVEQGSPKPQPAIRETTAQYLERGKAAAYLSIGKQSAAERYAVGRNLLNNMHPITPAPTSPGMAPNTVIDVRIVEVK